MLVKRRTKFQVSFSIIEQIETISAVQPLKVAKFTLTLGCSTEHMSINVRRFNVLYTAPTALGREVMVHTFDPFEY